MSQVPNSISLGNPSDAIASLPDTSTVDDVLTAQSPPTNLVVASANFQNNKRKTEKRMPSHDTTEIDAFLQKFATLMKTLDNPCNDEVNALLMNMSQVMSDPSNEILRVYELIVQRTGNDFVQLKYDYIKAAYHGYWALYHSMKSSINAYQVASSKEAKKAVADITSCATDIKTMFNTTVKQYNDYKTTLDHLAVSWNATVSSMTNFMEKVDRRTLEMAVPAQSQSSRPVPSASSKSGTQPLSATVATFAPGCQYKSINGTLQINDKGDTTFVPHTRIGETISKLVTAGIKGKTLYKLYNLDPEELSKRVNTHIEEMKDYKNLSQAQKISFIKSIMHGCTPGKNIWCRI